MGCLKNFLRAIIITLAVVGFMAIGGKDLISRYINNYFNPTKDEMLERAKKVGDFSHINDEFDEAELNPKQAELVTDNE